MDLDVLRAKNLAKLPPLDSRGFGTGSLTLNPDSRLRAMESLRVIRRVKAMGIPNQADLTTYVKGNYNQGDENSCVAYSVAGMQSTYEEIEHNRWITFDAEESYVANGGYGPNGISAVDALDWEESPGMRDISTGQRYKIATYAFANPMTDAGIQTIKAAIAAKRPCVLALLLPADFGDQFEGDGTCKSDVVTSGYHQICVVGYDQVRFKLLNSWGNNWGIKGIGSIKWSFVQKAEQRGWVYAYTTTDVTEPGSTPFFAEQMTEFFENMPTPQELPLPSKRKRMLGKRKSSK